MANAPQTYGPSQQGGASSPTHGHVRVGDYELGDVIGDRGTGTVHCARHIPSDKQVALKILHSRRQDVVDGLVRGAKAVSRVHHPNLVDITDVGATRDGTVYLAMELLSGESLQDRLHRVGPLPLFEAINIVRQAAHGLGAAHAAGVIHGGLEPAKLFLCRRDGRRRVVRRNKATDMKLVVEPEGKFDLVKILDLGLKRFLDLASYQSDLRETARYWSPEQAQRRPIDVRSDIYSLGAVFYEMITGTVPFDGASLAEVLRQHVSGLVTAPSQRSPTFAIDALVDTVILRCLHKTPALRFTSTDELCDALDACVTDRAFLRDAHRLAGIEESGIALPEARVKPRPSAEKAQEPAAQAQAPEKHEVENNLAKPAASALQERAARPAPSVAQPKPTSPPRAPEPTRATKSTPGVLEKSPVRTSPPSPTPDAAAIVRGALPPMPAMVARRPSVKAVPPTVPVTPPALANKTAPSELIPTVDQSALTEIVTPPPIALSSDLLTEIADMPAPVETPTGTGNADSTAVPAEALSHVEPEAPASRVDAPPVGPEPDTTVEPEATGSLAEASSASSPGEPLPSLNQAPSPIPQSAEKVEPASPVSERVEDGTQGEATQPDAATAQDFDSHGDRVDGSDDGQDELLAATWESWRRPKVMALAGVAVLGAIGIAVWTSRGKPTAAASARQTVTRPSPPTPPIQAPSPAREPAPSRAAVAPFQAAAPSEPAPAAGPPPQPVAAAETPTPQGQQAPTLAVAEATRLADKATAPAAVAVLTAPPAAPAEAAQPREATAATPVAAVVNGPKPASQKPRTASTTAKPAVPAARDLAIATEPAAAPRQAAATANLPPRLAGAWAPAAPLAVPRPATRSNEQPRGGGSKATAQPAPANADQLVREAQQAWLAGQHALALSRAQSALGASPRPAQAVQAYEIIATCSCALHKRERALEAASHLDTSRRDSVKAVCAKNGVPFE